MSRDYLRRNILSECNHHRRAKLYYQQVVSPPDRLLNLNTKIYSIQMPDFGHLSSVLGGNIVIESAKNNPSYGDTDEIRWRGELLLRLVSWMHRTSIQYRQVSISYQVISVALQ